MEAKEEIEGRMEKKGGEGMENDRKIKKTDFHSSKHSNAIQARYIYSSQERREKREMGKWVNDWEGMVR